MKIRTCSFSLLVLLSVSSQGGVDAQCVPSQVPLPIFDPCGEAELACLLALQLSGFDPADTGNYGSWWNNDSEVVVAETGTYKGIDSVKEYMSYGFGSPGPYFTASVDPNARVPLVLSTTPTSTGAGKCQVAFVSTFDYDYNAPRGGLYTLGGEIAATVMGIYEFGYWNLDPTAGTADIGIEKLRGFYPPTFWEIAASLYDTKAFKELLCQTMKKSCPDVWNKLESRRACKDDAKSLPFTDVYDPPLPFPTFDWRGASIGCRQLHLAFILEGNNFHCPHISVGPVPDGNGAIKCQNGNEPITADDLFTHDELTLAYTIGENVFGFDSSLLGFHPAAAKKEKTKKRSKKCGSGKGK